MPPMLLTALRLYFRTLKRVAPKTAGRHAYRLFSTPRIRRPVPSSVEGVMGRAERSMVTVDGEQVATYRWPAKAPEAPRVMLVHGWESRAARMAVWVDPLLDAGFEVLAFDAPAHGESTGQRTNPVVFATIIRAIADAAGPLYACVGHSLGGLSSILAITGCGPMQHPEVQMDRLVVVGGAESGVDAMGMFCEALGLGDDFLPLLLAGAAEGSGRAVKDLDGHRIFADHPVPTLWIHDVDDAEVSFEAAERVARTCPHVRLERVEGLGHHTIVRDPSVIQRGVDFLALE